MSNLDVALATFWQLARYWQQDEAAKLKLSCEAGRQNLNAEDIAPSEKAEKPKESFLEHENLK